MQALSSKSEAAPAVAVSKGHQLRNRIAGVFVTIAFIVAGSAGPALATPDPTDPTGGAGDTFFSGLSGYLTGHLIAAVLTLAVIGVSVSMLLKWGKKAAKSA